MSGRLGVAGFCPDSRLMTVILLVDVLGAAESRSEQIFKAYWISTIRGGPKCADPLGCDSDGSDASRSAVSGGGTSKVS